MPAFDPAVHEIDPSTGFQIDKATGLESGIHAIPPGKPESDDRDWPQWIPVHESHVLVKKMDGAPDHVSVPAFPDYHVNRIDGSVTVLVHDEDEAKIASSAPQAPKDVEAEDAERRARIAADEAAIVEAQHLEDEARANEAKDKAESPAH